MSGGLQRVDDDGPKRCTFCPRDAVGPCASCRAPVCGDCCTLTVGSAKTWAICLDCDRVRGRSLLGAWGGLAKMLGGILLALILLVALLEHFGAR